MAPTLRIIPLKRWIIAGINTISVIKSEVGVNLVGTIDANFKIWGK
jgi:hypothetical protein